MEAVGMSLAGLRAAAILAGERPVRSHRAAPLYRELTRRLRGADATTILGDLGFSSHEPPHGDTSLLVPGHRERAEETVNGSLSPP